MKKLFIFGALVIILLCAGAYFVMNTKITYKDGVYNASVTDSFGDLNLTLELKDGKIIKCDLIAHDKEGHVKDENYAKNSGEKNYELGQIAVNAIKKYPGMLIESQNIEELDAISGATVSFKQFKDMVNEVLKQASGR